MLKSIDLMYQAMLAELGQRSLDAAWSADFPSDGRFTPLTVKQRRYWYFDRPDGKGGRTRDYVGPESDPEIAKRVEEFKAQKDDLRARRRMVSTLTREGGMVAPDRMSGDDIEALASGGLFRLRGILIGTIAFQTYAGVLSVRLPGHSIKDGRRGRRAGFRCQPRSRRQHAADPTIAAVGRPDLSACPTSIRTSRLLELSKQE